MKTYIYAQTEVITSDVWLIELELSDGTEIKIMEIKSGQIRIALDDTKEVNINPQTHNVLYLSTQKDDEE